MNRKFIAIGIALSLGLSAQATTPEDVMDPYKSYRAALKDQNLKQAAEFAHEAWQKAEDLLGDSRMTGDLASNFADMAPVEVNGDSARKDVSQAYERSIELAYLVPAIGDEIEIQRRIDFLSWGLPRKKRDWPSKAFDLDALSSQIKTFGFENTTYEADYLSLKAQRFFRGRKWDQTIETSRHAIATYSKVEDPLPSNLQFVIPVFLAQALSEKKMPIESALTYQDLMDGLVKQNGDNFQINPVTARQWLEQRDAALALDKADDRSQQIRDYKLPIDQTMVRPIIFKIPVAPLGFRRGHKSGKVAFKFDVDEDGHVVKSTIVGSTHKILHPQAFSAVKGLRFPPNLPAQQREGLDHNVTFILLTETRDVLPFGDMKPRST